MPFQVHHAVDIIIILTNIMNHLKDFIASYYRALKGLVKGTIVTCSGTIKKNRFEWKSS